MATKEQFPVCRFTKAACDANDNEPLISSIHLYKVKACIKTLFKTTVLMACLDLVYNCYRLVSIWITIFVDLWAEYSVSCTFLLHVIIEILAWIFWLRYTDTKIPWGFIFMSLTLFVNL